MVNLLAASRTDSTLTLCCLQQLWCLTYCCSPTKSKTVHAPTAAPEVDLGLIHTNVCAAGDSQSPHWPSEGDSPTRGLAGHFMPGWDTLPGTHGSWNQRALQPHRRKPRIWMKPINTRLAINNPQLSVQENQLPHHLKCSTCTYMKILKGSFKRYAGVRRRSWRGWVLPRIRAYSSLCLTAFASCLS